jgi:hypothetical protein
LSRLRGRGTNGLRRGRLRDLRQLEHRDAVDRAGLSRYREGRVDDYALDGRPALMLNRRQAGLDAGEASGLGLDLRVDLGPAQPEPAAQLGGGDPVQLGKLARLVEAVSAGRVDAGGLEQPDRVVVAQHPDRDPAVALELSDAEHGGSRSTA